MEARMDRLSSFNSSSIYEGKSLHLKKQESIDSSTRNKVKEVFEKQHSEDRIVVGKEAIDLSDSEGSDSVELFPNAPIQPAEVRKILKPLDEKTAKIGNDRFNQLKC